MPAYEMVDKPAPFEALFPSGHSCPLSTATKLLIDHAEEEGSSVLTGQLSTLKELLAIEDAQNARKLNLDENLRVNSSSVPEQNAHQGKHNTEVVEESKRLLIIMTQKHYFPGILAGLKEESLSKRLDYPEAVRRPIFELGLKLDDDGIIRSYGRIAVSAKRAERRKLLDRHILCPDTGKALVLLPGTGFLSESIMYSAHLDTLHGGRNTMTHYSRQEYWVIGSSKIAE